MIQSSLQVKPTTQEISAKALRPIPPNGMGEKIQFYRTNELPISVVTVVCRSEHGRINDKVLEVALVEHTKGGGHMLPQGEYPPWDTPFTAAASLLKRELNLPKKEQQFVQQSCMLIGYLEHLTPLNRRDPSSEIGSEEEKLLIFLKICVNAKFTHTKHADIKEVCWVEDLQQAKKLMDGMRSSAKYFAERDAIMLAAGWK